MGLEWGVQTNLEKSLKDFLVAQATTDSVDVNIDIGENFDNSWQLPHIQIYLDSKQKPRAELGSNKRANTYLIFLDVRATNNPERMNLADWIENSINDGFKYYTYVSNPANRDVPIKTETGYVSFNYVSSQKVELGQDVNEYDQWRYRISINAWIIITV